jgi:hypothetical protein
MTTIKSASPGFALDVLYKYRKLTAFINLVGLKMVGLMTRFFIS